MKKWAILAKLLHGANGHVLNVGANVGQEIPFLLKHGRGRVYAIEPVEENAKQIRVKYRHEPRVRTFKHTMAGTEDWRTFHINDHPGTHSLLPWNDECLKEQGVSWHTVKVMQVLTRTLDWFCAMEKIDRAALLFMDVQGAELEVLRGAEGLLKSGAIEAIFGEQIQKPIYQGVPPFSDVRGYLEGFGYRLLGTFKSQTKDENAHFDFLFVKGA